MKIIVTTTTYPESNDDPVPRFVYDQILAFHAFDKSIEIHVLLPFHSYTSKIRNKSTGAHSHTEHRFHYFPIHSVEKLCGRGIIPAIKKNPFRALLIPCLMIAQHRALTRLCNEISPDLIYAHWFVPQAIVACSVGKKQSIPYVFTTHSSDVQILKYFPFARQLIDYHLKRAHHFTAVSSSVAQKLTQFFDENYWKKTHSEKLSIIPMGTSPPAMEQEEGLHQTFFDQHGIPHDCLLILAMGRLVEKKGFSYLLQGFGKLSQEARQSAHIVIAGHGDSEPNLRKLTEQLDIDAQVTFVGHVHTREKSILLNHATVMLIPSITAAFGDVEGFPVTFMEAIAHGCVVVASDATGLNSVISDCGGILVPEQDAYAITQALDSIINMDITQIAEIREKARDVAHEYYWPNIAQRHLAVMYQDTNHDTHNFQLITPTSGSDS